MSNIILYVNRMWETKNSTVSEFNGLPIDGINGCKRGVKGYILEENGPSTTERNKDLRIPAGVYSLDWHNSPRFGKNLPRLYNNLVPRSRYILIHNGNSAKDTEGCLLVGETRSVDFVGGSVRKLNELLDYLGCFDLNSGKYSVEITESF